MVQTSHEKMIRHHRISSDVDSKVFYVHLLALLTRWIRNQVEPLAQAALQACHQLSLDYISI